MLKPIKKECHKIVQKHIQACTVKCTGSALIVLLLVHLEHLLKHASKKITFMVAANVLWKCNWKKSLQLATKNTNTPKICYRNSSLAWQTINADGSASQEVTLATRFWPSCLSLFSMVLWQVVRPSSHSFGPLAWKACEASALYHQHRFHLHFQWAEAKGPHVSTNTRLEKSCIWFTPAFYSSFIQVLSKVAFETFESHYHIGVRFPCLCNNWQTGEAATRTLMQPLLEFWWSILKLVASKYSKLTLKLWANNHSKPKTSWPSKSHGSWKWTWLVVLLSSLRSFRRSQIASAPNSDVHSEWWPGDAEASEASTSWILCNFCKQKTNMLENKSHWTAQPACGNGQEYLSHVDKALKEQFKQPSSISSPRKFPMKVAIPSVECGPSLKLSSRTRSNLSISKTNLLLQCPTLANMICQRKRICKEKTVTMRQGLTLQMWFGATP